MDAPKESVGEMFIALSGLPNTIWVARPRPKLHLSASGVGVPTINQTVSTLRFLFRGTLRRYEIVEHTHVIREPRKLPVVLSVAEVARLLDAAPGLKYKAALSVAYGAGLRAAEVISLKSLTSTASR